MTQRDLILILAGTLLIGPLLGCGAVIKSATSPMMEDLTRSVMKQQDVQLVRDGAPAFLLMIDGMLEGNPGDVDHLLAAASLYSAYNAAFLLDHDPKRAQLTSVKARMYAFRAMMSLYPEFKRLRDKPFAEFKVFPATIGEEHKRALYLVITTWAAYVQTHSDSWNNVAQIAKLQRLAERLLELDESYMHGAPHLALGTLHTLLPKALGGKPALAKKHFERAIAISRGKFLPALVLYAKRYAKPIFDRELHDRLLRRVLETPATVLPEQTLVNALARAEAKKLLQLADDYF